MEFDIVGPDAIAEGSATDAYFDRTETTLRHAGRNPRVVAEVTADQFPDGDFELLAGVKDAAALLEGRDVDVDAIPPGRLFDGAHTARRRGPSAEPPDRSKTALTGYRPAVGPPAGPPRPAAQPAPPAWTTCAVTPPAAVRRTDGPHTKQGLRGQVDWLPGRRELIRYE